MSTQNDEHDQIDVSTEDTVIMKKTYVSPTFSHIESISTLVAAAEGNGSDGGVFAGDTFGS